MYFCALLFLHMQLFLTEDGSHTLYSELVEECYHSIHGAIQESNHIFMDSAWNCCRKPELNIFEVGFGTGLNAFLTLCQAGEERKKVYYTSVEYYPLEVVTARKLNFAAQINPAYEDLFVKMHESPWNEPVEITPFFVLNKIQGDFTALELENSYDVIYFDAFSPDKQPDMWAQERFEMLYNHTAPGGVLTTYCAKGMVRRAMQAAGYQVERLPGPPGKREILRAVRR